VDHLLFSAPWFSKAWKTEDENEDDEEDDFRALEKF
jgi:hypothetical protein